jgi:hypothetical protein
VGRETDIRALTQPLLDELYELHDRSESSGGEPQSRKDDKLRDAYRAIQIWWQLYGSLIWAQSRIVGHEMVRASPERMAALTKMGFDEYSDLVEFLGFGHSHVHPDNRPPPESEISFSDAAALRNAIVRLLASSEQTSSVWRDPLSHALRAANAGEVHPLFDPGKKRRRGRPYVLDSARAVAVAHVHYLVGKGFKKHVALDRVSKTLAASSETIRSWEKSLGQDRWFSNLWKGAYLAGQLEMEGHVVFEEEVEPIKHDFEPESVPDCFIRFIERLHDDWSLEAVQERLRKFHSDEKSGD